MSRRIQDIIAKHRLKSAESDLRAAEQDLEDRRKRGENVQQAQVALMDEPPLSA